MIAYGRQSLGATRRRPLQMMNGVFHKSEWMDSGQGAGLAPTVFLAEQPPDCDLEPHFHRQNQFQLFMHGSGSLGPDTVRTVTVHYAGAYTGYGPLKSGADGLKYFTIRSAFDTGIIPATQAREKMVRGPKRHAQAFVGEPWGVERLSALTQIEQETVLVAKAGLGAVVMRLPPLAVATSPPLEGSPGQFIFVLSGSGHIGTEELQAWESAFVPAADGAAAMRAGSGGAQIIALHIPDTAPEYVQI